MPLVHFSVLSPLSSLLLAALLIVAPTARGQIKIMPLGDSITKGAVDPAPSLSGYRARLFDDLTAMHVRFQFIGCADANSNPAMIAAGQQFHNGYGSWRIDSLLANFEGVTQPGGDNNMGGFWFSGAADKNRPPAFPDLVLLLAGTNDLGAGASEAVLETRMTALLGWLQSHRPKAHVFVGTVPPRGPDKPGWEIYNPAVVIFNKWLTAKANSLGTHFHALDLYALFVDPSGRVKDATAPDGIFLKDGIHPSHKGYVAMGDAWFASIKPFLTPGH